MAFFLQLSTLDMPSIINLKQKSYICIDWWHNRHIDQELAYLYQNNIILRRTWGDEVRNVSVLVAIGVDSDVFHQVFGVFVNAPRRIDPSGHALGGSFLCSFFIISSLR